MGLHIFGLHKHDRLHIQNLQYILGDIVEENQCNFPGKSIQLAHLPAYNYYLVHMVMDRMDFVVLEEVL